MKILVIGGTVFLGRHLVAAALEAGHEVTTFNRGNNQLPEQDGVEKLKGDRATDLACLTGRRFDAVIDTCGFAPDVVEKTARALSASIDVYLFVSTISVYQSFARPVDEESPTLKIENGDKGNYGSLKAASEKVIQSVLGRRALIVRPGLIVGPYDPTDRFTYWPARVARGGKVLVPADLNYPVQFIDARDLANWMIDMVAHYECGTYDAVGPDYELSMQKFLDACKQVAPSDAQFEPVQEQDLLEKGVTPWMELPLWIPKSQTDSAYFMTLGCRKAIDAGLNFRPLSETVKDTLDWDKTRPEGDRKAGLTIQREMDLLKTSS